jgi:hypothetical protein
MLSWNVGGAAICLGRRLATSYGAPWWEDQVFESSGARSFGPISAGYYRLGLRCYNRDGFGESAAVTFQVQ